MKNKFDWRVVYFNLVSVVAIIVFLIAAINAGQGLLRVLIPKTSLRSDEWQQVESFAAFKRGQGKLPRAELLQRAAGDSLTTPLEDTSEAELRAQWGDYRSLVVEGEKRRGLWNLLQALVMALVAVPLFWWHRRGAERVRRREDDTD